MERASWTDERIDGLVKRIEQRFADVDRRFDEVDRRFEAVERRLDRIEDQLIAIRRDMHNQLLVIMFGQVTGFLTLAGIMVAKL
jgi:DNA anti-recombination protein RmuC